MKKIIVIIFSICSFSYAQDKLLSQAEPYLYSQPDSAYFFLEKLSRQSLKNQNYIQALKALTYINYVSAYHGHFKKFQSSLRQEDQIIEKLSKRIDSLPGGTYYKHYYWYDKGSYFYMLNDYERSRSYFFQLLNSTEKMPDSLLKAEYSPFITGANNYLATTYLQESKYAVAEEFYKENVRLHKKFGDPINLILDTKNLLASLEAAKGDFHLSNEHAKEALEYYEKTDPDNNINSFLSTGFLLVNNYLELQQPDSAAIYLDKVVPLLKLRPRFYSDYYELKGDIQERSGNFNEALEIYQKAIRYLKESEENADEISLLYKKMGDLYFQNHLPQKALEYYYSGMDLYQTEEQIKKTASVRAYNTLGLLQLLRAAGKAEIKLGEDINHQNVIKYGFLGIQKLNELKKAFYDEKDKQLLVENIIPIFENALFSCYSLYRNSENAAFIDTAFVFIESSKSGILQDALSHNKATKFADVPESLLENEKLLKIEIAQLEKKAQLNQDSLASSQLFAARRSHEKLVENIEKQYPRYFNLKYNTETISLSDFKKELSGGVGAILYFYGAENLFSISVSREKTKFLRVKLQPKNKDSILKLQKLLGSPASDISQINSLSNKIYQKFLEASFLTENITNYIIMPDGPLRSIPFGSLAVKKGKPEYLLEHYSISYAPSANLWTQLQEGNIEKNSILAFAPDFSTSSEFSNLGGNKREVEQISKRFNTKIFTGEQASLSNFKRNADRHTIIHLATHAQTNDEFPEYSFLAFNQTSKGENFLYINDLYNLNIYAKMICLSACETGIGKLRQGEGFISLARAFYYAGAKSIIYSLWKIQDKASSEIMSGFYGYLEEGKSKDQALRSAKLDFLKEHREEGFSHPYYWAGFVVSGNTTALAQNSNFIWYLCGGILLLGIGWVLFRKIS